MVGKEQQGLTILAGCPFAGHDDESHGTSSSGQCENKKIAMLDRLGVETCPVLLVRGRRGGSSSSVSGAPALATTSRRSFCGRRRGTSLEPKTSANVVTMTDRSTSSGWSSTRRSESWKRRRISRLCRRSFVRVVFIVATTLATGSITTAYTPRATQFCGAPTQSVKYGGNEEEVVDQEASDHAECTGAEATEDNADDDRHDQTSAVVAILRRERAEGSPL